MKAMDVGDPATKDVLRLEGAKKWLAGSPDGFEELVEAAARKSSARTRTIGIWTIVSLRPFWS